MGQDGNTIEIVIDAADTLAAVESAKSANQSLKDYKKALDAFSNHVTSLNTTTTTTNEVLKDLTSLLNDVPKKLRESLDKMHENVISSYEPKLEKNLDAMVSRVVEKVCGKVQGQGESRTQVQTATGKQPASPVATVAQPPEEKPDVLKRDRYVSSVNRVVDAMGNVVSTVNATVSREQQKRYIFEKERNAAGELVDVRKEFVDDVKTTTQTKEKFDPFSSMSDALYSSLESGSWSNPMDIFAPQMLKMAEKNIWAPIEKMEEEKFDKFSSITDALNASLEKGFADPMRKYEGVMTNLAEKNIWKPYEKQLTGTEKANRSATKAEIDRASAIRKEITGALIAVHVMKVTAQGSQVFNAGLQVMNAGFSHLLNNIMLPMMPVFVMIGQIFHTVANVVAMLPGPMRLVLGYLVLWKATSMLFAAMPIREVLAGFTALNETLKGGGSRIQMFVNGVRAFFQFMNSGIGGPDGIFGGIRKRIGKRASGGPVLGSGAYIVGEKGPELFIPKTSGTIIPNHKIGRAEGGEVTAAPFGGDPLGNLGAGLGVGALAYMLTGSPLLAAGVGVGAGMLGPEGIASGIASIVSSDIGSNFIASINVLTGMIQSILAPLAPIMGVVAIALGAVSGLRGAGGGGDRTADTVYRVGTEQLKATGKMNFGVQSAVGLGARGTNKILSMILVRLGNCLYVDPCNGMIAQFDGLKAALTAIPTALATAISTVLPIAVTTALAGLIGTITYTVITQGALPSLAIAGVITYTIFTVGDVPIAKDVNAKIKYIIETIGEKPVVADTIAKIRYVVEAVGERPIVQDVVAKISYVREVVGEIPVVNTITNWIESRFREISESEYTTLKQTVEVKGAANPPKITARILADGTIEGKIPTLDIVPTIDTAKIPEKIVRPEGMPKVDVEPIVDPAKIPKEILVGGESPKISIDPKIDTAKLPRVIEIPQGIAMPKLEVELTSDGVINLGEVKPKVPVDYLLPKGQVLLPDGTKAEMPVEIDLTSPEFKNGKWLKFEGGRILWTGDGAPIGMRIVPPTDDEAASVKADITRKLGGVDVKITPNPESGTTGGNFIDVLKAKLGLKEGVKVDVKPAELSLPSWEAIGKTAGKAAGFGAVAGIGGYFAEWQISGVAPKIGEYLTTFMVTSAGFIGLEAVASAFEGSLVGAIAGVSATVLAVAGAAVMSVAAVWMAKDLIGGIVTAFNTGDWSGMKFNNVVLDELYAQGGKFTLEQGQSWVLWQNNLQTALLNNTNDIRTVLAGGIPVDVNFNVESVKNIVETIASSATSGNAVTYNPNDPAQAGSPAPYDPNNPSGLPPQYQTPIPPEQTACENNGGQWDPQLWDPARGAFGSCVGRAFADGGRPPVGMPSLVGERGPELFVPDGVGASGGSPTINFSPTFNVTTNNPRELVDTVMRELKLELARVKM